MPVDRPLAPRAATVVCFAAICSAKRSIFRIFLTNVLDTVFFGVVNLRYLGSVGIVGAAFIKILAGSKKREESSMCFFQNKCSGTKTKVRLGCRRSPPLPPSPPLLTDFVNSLLIGNRPPWHLSIDILTSRTWFLLHSCMGQHLHMRL
jgi:hypothetical protein